MTAIADQVDAMEIRLHDAMLASDVTALDTLLADDLVFTNQAGQRLSKADDLAAHASGLLKIERIDISERRIRPSGTGAVVTLVADLAGSYDGQRFSGRFAYTRVWETADGHWKVAAAHCSAIG